MVFTDKGKHISDTVGGKFLKALSAYVCAHQSQRPQNLINEGSGQQHRAHGHSLTDSVKDGELLGRVLIEIVM